MVPASAQLGTVVLGCARMVIKEEVMEGVEGARTRIHWPYPKS